MPLPPSEAAAGGEIARRFRSLTGLNILSNLTLPLASLVDTALLGHLDDIRFLAGVALAGVLFEYLYWSFGFLRMGTTGTTAQAVGRQDREEAFRILYRGLLLAGLLGAGLLLLRAPLGEVGFRLLAASEGVEAAGTDYFAARIWAAPAALANFVLLGWFLGRSESRRALLLTVVANAANVLLDYLFIVRWGWAAGGAGLATALSQYAMLATGLALLLRERPLPRWRWREVVHRPALVPLLRLNLDIMVRTVALVTAFALFTNASALLGTLVLAANSILYRLQTLAAYLVDGAAFAVESLAGWLAGRGDAAGLAAVRRLGLAAGLLFASLFSLALVLLPRAILSLLTSHAETVEIAVGFLPWLPPVLLLGAVAFIYDGYYLGLTRGRRLRNAMLVSLLAVFLPLAGVAAARGSGHLLWLAMLAFMGARAALLHHRLPGADAPQTAGG